MSIKGQLISKENFSVFTSILPKNERETVNFCPSLLRYGSEEKDSSLYKYSILLGFILSKNLRGL